MYEKESYVNPGSGIREVILRGDLGSHFVPIFFYYSLYHSRGVGYCFKVTNW